jgi:hypothetical protein
MQTKPGLLLALLLILIVSLSGCTGIPVTTGNGVVVRDFDADFTEVYSGEPVNFNLRVQNTGSASASKVHAELLGIDEDWCCEPIGRGPWLNKQKLPNEEECRYTSEGFTLIPPNPQYGTEGETHICTWSYKAPDLPASLSVTYTPTARIFYRYSSDVVKSVTIVPRIEMKALEEQGKTLPIETVSSTSSPIALDIETEGPIRSFENSVKFPLSIKMSNVGGGVVCLHECKKTRVEDPHEEWNRLGLTITFANPSVMNLVDCEDQFEVVLYKGRENSVTCMVEARDLPLTRTQRLIKVHADYDYFIEKEIPVTVSSRS